MIMLELLPNDSGGRQRNFDHSPISSIVWMEQAIYDGHADAWWLTKNGFIMSRTQRCRMEYKTSKFFFFLELREIYIFYE